MKGRMIAFAALLLTPHVAVAANAPTAEQQAAIAKAKALLQSLHPQTGDVKLPAAHATLHLGRDYYFLPADEAKRVLTEVWGNPPEAVEGTLGLVMPAGKTPYDDSWGAVISYDSTGHIKDDDAKSEDYDQIITQAHEAEAEVNKRRQEQGYPGQHLVGWAQPPSYDPATHSMIWARNISIDGQSENTLNYDVRLLGRTGVLSLNLITGMSQLAETRASAATFGKSAEFDAGSRYADYVPGTDKLADYGLVGLVAGGVGVAAAKKLGLLAIALGLGKKLIVLVVAGFALLRNKIMALFGRRDAQDDYDYAEASVATDEEPPAEPAPADRTA